MSSPLNNRNIHGVGLPTTDATQTIAATIGTLNNRAYLVEAHVLAVNTTDNTQAASYVLVGLFNNNGGTLAQVGSTTNVSTIESNAAWDVAFAVSGTDIQIKVTGAAGTNISWLVDADIKNLGAVLANSGIVGEEA